MKTKDEIIEVLKKHETMIDDSDYHKKAVFPEDYKLIASELFESELNPIKDIKTEVIKFMGSWTVKFTIGNQSFYLLHSENKKTAEWTEKMLQKAFDSLIKEQPSDEEIEKYVVSKYPVIEFQDKEDFKMDVNSYFRECLIRELKAMREGLIPVSGEDEYDPDFYDYSI